MPAPHPWQTPHPGQKCGSWESIADRYIMRKKIVLWCSSSSSPSFVKYCMTCLVKGVFWRSVRFQCQKELLKIIFLFSTAYCMRKTVKKSLYLCSHHDLVFMLLWQQLLWGLQSAWQQTSQWRIIWDHLRRTWPRWRTDLVPSWTPSSNPSVHRFGHTEQQFDHVLFITFY